MENGKHKTNSFDSLNSWSKKTNLLSSFQGGAGGRLSYSLPFREGPGVGFSPRQAQLILKISVSGVSGVSSVSFRFWTKKTPVFGPNRNKTGVSSVSAVPSVPHQRGPLTKREARLTNRACERLTHKTGVSSVPHPYSLPFREGSGVGFSLSPSAKRG